MKYDRYIHLASNKMNFCLICHYVNNKNNNLFIWTPLTKKRWNVVII